VKFGYFVPLTLLFILSLGDAAWATRIVYWRFNKPLNRIEIITDEGVQPEAQFFPNPARLVIDLPNVRIRRKRQRQNLTRYVRAVRIAQNNPTTARIVLEMHPRFTIQPRNVQVRSTAPNRWFIQLPNYLPIATVDSEDQQRVTIDVPRRPTPPPDSRPGPIADNPDAPSAPARPLPSGAITVVIDPGHGGPDPGAVGRGGIMEKHIVMSIGSQVATRLRQRGIKAVLTRTGDVDLDLQPRVALAERVRARVFVSIHANAISMSRPDINGLESFYYGSSDGYRLAAAIHNSILRSVSVRDRGIRQARFYVIRKTSMPAALIETGYVTGAQDAANLKSPAHRTRLAEAIAQGILNFLRR
jgi:N-acetylmuramoyl-L-alanine amidase